jgi:TAP-like protein
VASLRVRYEQDVRHDSRRFPIAGALAANIWPCAFWPNGPLQPPLRAGRHGPRNLLLVNNLRDPATPYVGAVATRHDFGDGVDQGGHGVYLINPNACASSTVTGWLVDGTMPARDTVCPQDQNPARAPGSRTAPMVRSGPFAR